MHSATLTMTGLAAFTLRAATSAFLLGMRQSQSAMFHQGSGLYLFVSFRIFRMLLDHLGESNAPFYSKLHRVGVNAILVRLLARPLPREDSLQHTESFCNRARHVWAPAMGAQCPQVLVKFKSLGARHGATWKFTGDGCDMHAFWK